MNVESITPNDFTWLGLLPTVILIVGVLVVVLAVRAGLGKTAKGLALVSIAFLAALVGSVIAALSIGHDTRAANTEIVISHFEKSYGLKLDEVDLRRLHDVDYDNVTRNLTTADGSLKQVLFRVEDGLVLPYTMDSDGSWIPMPAAGGAT